MKLVLFILTLAIASSSFGAQPAVTYNSVTRITSPADADLRGDTLTLTGAMILPDGVRQTFNPGATTPGLNWGSIAGDPSAPSNGDSWYNSVENAAKVRINGVNVTIGSGSAPVGTILNPSPGTQAALLPLVTADATGTNAYGTNVLTVNQVNANDLYVSNAIPVSVGGTGRTNYTAGGIPVGNGTNAMTEVLIEDTAYDATSWNANTNIATKNAIRDKFEDVTDVAHGGTGKSSVTSSVLLSGNGTTALDEVAIGSGLSLSGSAGGARILNATSGYLWTTRSNLVTISNTTSEITILSGQIGAGVLTTNGVIRFTGGGIWRNETSGNLGWTFRVYLGGVEIFSDPIVNTTSAATTGSILVSGFVANLNSLSAQGAFYRTFGSGRAAPSGTVTGGDLAANAIWDSAAAGGGTVNTSGATDFSLTVQPNAATATGYITLYSVHAYAE